MPKNKSPTVVFIKKQKKLISSRLMQISLKMDDYIYKDIPISVKSAEMFIQEVSSYQDKCYGDKPSLQVIEKLIHCMKGIIAEQQDLQPSGANTDVTLVDVQSILAPSVDDDLTQCTPNIDANNILEVPNNNINVIDICHDIANGCKHLNLIENEIIDLSNDDNEYNDTKRDGPSNELLQKSISKLTISDDPLRFTNLDPEIYSQSILSSFERVNDCSTRNTHNVKFSHDFEADIQPVTISRKNPRNSRPTTKYIASTVAVKTTEKQKHANKSNTVNSTESMKILEPSVQSKRKRNKNTDNEKVRRRRGPNKIKRAQDEKKPNKKLPVKRNKQNNIVVEKKNAETKALRKISMPETVEKDQIPILSRWIDNTYQQGCCAQVQDNSNATETVKDIYNKNVENDLSWIENIRYVREVTQEEHISAVIENGFWEDYTLPNDWNDDDFLYN